LWLCVLLWTGEMIDPSTLSPDHHQNPAHMG
jgi:hypothetical protein